MFTWYLAERDLSHVYGIRNTFFAKFDGQTARTWRKFLAALLDTSQFLQFFRLFSKSILRLLAFASESRKKFPLALRAREKNVYHVSYCINHPGAEILLTKLLTDTLYVVLPKVLPLSVLFLALAPAGKGGGGNLR